MSFAATPRRRQQQPANDSRRGDGNELPCRARPSQCNDRREDRQGGPLAIGAEILRHAPYRMGDDGDRDDFQAVQPTRISRSAKRRHTESKKRQR